VSTASHLGDDEYSRADRARRPARRARAAVAILALAGIASLVVATLAPILRVEVGGRVRAGLDRSGWDVHGPALLLIAIVALVLLGLALRGSLAAALALALCGLAALAIAIGADLPDIGQAGLVGEQLLSGTTRAGLGADAEVLGGVLLLACGGILAFTGRQ
jgi:hypothetical protein